MGDLPAPQLFRDQPPDILSFLNRRLRHAGHRMSVLHDRCRVTYDEHSGRAHDLEERVNERTPRAVGFGTEHLWNRRRRYPRCPEYRCARDPLSARDNALVIYG